MSEMINTSSALPRSPLQPTDTRLMSSSRVYRKAGCKQQLYTGLLITTMLLCLVFASVTDAQADGSTHADDAERHVVLVVGDSISSAYGMPTEAGWVALLQQRFDNENLTLEVVNASVTGDTTSNGLARLPDLLTEYEPAIVIVELGGNDGLRGLSAKKMKDNLYNMASMAKDVGADVVIVAVQLPGNYGKAYSKLFQEAFANAAQSSESALVESLFTGMDASSKWFQSDGIHPSIEAQAVMLENVWPSLSPAIDILLSE